MIWPVRVQTILNTFAALHPTWVADERGPEPTPRYRLNQLFVEQVRFEFGSAYGFKSNGLTAPISSENLAWISPMDGLVAWAWENTHDGRVEQFPEAHYIPDQTFHPATPIDHLGGGIAPPVPPIPPAEGVYWGDEQSRAMFGRLMVVLLSDYARAHNPVDDGVGVWLGRMWFDVDNGESVETALPRHRAEWCAILRIPVL